MHKLELTGLSAGLPIGVMAAFGVLRICCRVLSEENPRLEWTNSGTGFHAVLHTNNAINRNQIVKCILDGLPSGIHTTALTWADQLKSTKAKDFAARAKSVIELSDRLNREDADWFAALGSEVVTDDDEVETTPFDMSVARQKFPADGVNLTRTLAAGGLKEHPAFEEALFGPWAYTDDQHSFGWDPTTIKMGAFTNRAPTAMPNSGVRAAVWLAFQSLPLFPCFYAGTLAVRAFKREKGQPVFCWPIWKGAIGIPELKSLLGWSAVVTSPQELPIDEVRTRGILALYQSARYKPNKYLACFRPPKLVYIAAERG